MAYAWFDHEADIGVIGTGATVEEALVDAAQATFALMVDPAQVAPVLERSFAFDEADLELALVTWLNLLIGEGLAFCRFALRRDGAHWLGQAWGEQWRDDLERGTEVKGATLSELSVRHGVVGWEARCIVDV